MEKPWYQSFNWSLAVTAIAISVLGVIAIQSADLHNSGARGEWQKQAAYLIVGVFVMAVCALVDYHRWQHWARSLWIANFAILGIVTLLGYSAKGAVRWLSLGPLGTIQPSEPAKLVLAVVAAAMLARATTVGPRVMLLTIAAVGVPSLLILKQPDLGTTLVVFAILTAQLFFAVNKPVYLAAYGAVVAALATLAVGTNLVLKPFQRNRLLVFLKPNADPLGAGYNLNQSKIAVGSGELLGKGLFHGTQTQLQFVPEHSRDFIFTVIGEELGYVGSVLLIVLYAVILIGGIRAILASMDKFGLYLAVGLTAMLAFHITVNIGMTVGIMPITGIPLPFMSYGGSAILTNFAAIGVLLNIHIQRDRLVF